VVALSKFLALLAEAFGKAREAQEGLKVTGEALKFVQDTNERYYEAELYRIKGELLLQQSGAEQTMRMAAEGSFLKAIEIARRQGAKSLELRAVVSLARLYRKDGGAEDIRSRLEEVYSWFAEGADTVDLNEARALLNELT
jgi:predicted ATPase